MKRAIPVFLFTTILFAAYVTRSVPKPSSDEETLKNLETESMKHFNNTEADIAFQKTILAPHFTTIDVFGVIHDQTYADIDKDAATEKAANPDAKSSAEIKDLKVRIYGDTATVTKSGTFTATGMKDTNMNVNSAPFVTLDVWQKQSGKWKLIAGSVVSTQSIPAEAYKAATAAN
jgi:hypothetical protein